MTKKVEKEIVGVCRFCGEQKFTTEKTESAADETVTYECDCPEGEEWRREERKIKTRKETLERVKASLSDMRTRLLENFNIEITDETAEEILQSTAKIYDGKYGTMTLRRGIITAKISVGKKNLIALSIKTVIEEKTEI